MKHKQLLEGIAIQLDDDAKIVKQLILILCYTIVHDISSQNIFLYNFPTFQHSYEKEI